ncbi:VOC family protein [Paraburkholderia sp. J41]|uniref:VOC family protein n=1 Tax=Paraburkholderia sp. J41 TaxID=2805433 RepID=UPI002AC35227|nr:VOC family protein [Paraburkholderia sp. J41]
MSNPSRPSIDGVHHFKIPVADLVRAMAFYGRILGAEPIPELDHHTADGSVYAHICDVPGLGTKLEIRLDPAQAADNKGFDSVTIAVRDRATLDDWAAFLYANGIEHSPVLAGVQAWLVVFDDPDGNRLRFYTLEKHGANVSPDEDSPWVRN